ncbi:hypothetical protein SAMN02982917_3591 [Azospirillum oryzae]|uniref:Protein L n=1 Tax=Azospirillum oryzae TaxID=286727 RepID=A0A1X7GBQ7_9PROT|nr:hypothetical protein SAMN02982917_3591 [Azospirillum oryzae]
MPIFNDKQYFEREEDIDFLITLSPHDEAPRSGIYRCEHCGYEIVSVKGRKLPPQSPSVHEHKSPHRGLMSATQAPPIEWRLVAIAKHLDD